MKNKIINQISEFELDKIVEIHKNSYHKDHFTSKFNNNKLKEYYNELIKFSDLSILSLDKNTGECLGFIISGNQVSRGINSFIKKNKRYLFFLMIKNPIFLFEKIYYKIYIKLFYKKIILKKEKRKKTRLLSISVDSNHQSKGIGKSLLIFFEEELKNREIYEYGLSVRESNKDALRFYLKNGFREEKKKLKSVYLIKNIGVNDEKN